MRGRKQPNHCTAPGCVRPCLARNLCRAHYRARQDRKARAKPEPWTKGTITFTPRRVVSLAAALNPTDHAALAGTYQACIDEARNLREQAAHLEGFATRLMAIGARASVHFMRDGQG